MANDPQNRNLPAGWTGTLVEIDLSSVPTLPPDSFYQASLVVDHPASQEEHGLELAIHQNDRGEWTASAKRGHRDSHSQSWIWKELGDCNTQDMDPILRLIDELDLEAERTIEDISDRPDGDPNAVPAPVLRKLAQHLTEAAEHLAEAHRRATKGT